MKIFISMLETYYNANPYFVEYFRNKGFEVVFTLESKVIEEDKVFELFANCDICITNTRPVTRAMIELAPTLKMIAVFGVGYNHIDLEAANEKGIYVTNGRGGNARAVAEHTFALFLALVRKVVHDDKNIRMRKWVNPMGFELYGKTLGIIGFGAIGREVAKIALGGFCMNILVYDPYVSDEQIRVSGAISVSIVELMSVCDFISVHIPLTSMTMSMIDETLLPLMKKKAYIVNMSRGGIVNEKALFDALSKSMIAGAGLDVHENEPIGEGNPSLFETFDNVILTSHSGASSVESISKIGLIIKENIDDIVMKRAPRNNVVNKPNNT